MEKVLLVFNHLAFTQIAIYGKQCSVATLDLRISSEAYMHTRLADCPHHICQSSDRNRPIIYRSVRGQSHSLIGRDIE